MFCKKKQEFTAGGLVEQHVYEAVGSINDIDHQPLHFVVVEARYVVPGNEAARTVDRHIRVVPGREDGEMPAWRSSSIELRKQCRTMYFASRCCSTGSVTRARSLSFMGTSRSLNMT